MKRIIATKITTTVTMPSRRKEIGRMNTKGDKPSYRDKTDLFSSERSELESA
jgi:hypothetical protein